MRTIEADGVQLCVDTVGSTEDPAVLLIAGSNSSMDWWPDEFCARLAAGGRFVVRYDHRDTGGSTHYPAGSPGYTSADLAGDVLRVLDGVGVRRAHLVGISMGGGLAMVVALAHPDRVASLALLSTTAGGPDLPPPDAEVFAGAADPDWSDPAAAVESIVDYDRRLSGSGQFDEAASRATVARMLARTADVAASQTNHMAAESGGDDRPLAPRLAGLTVPTLVIHGTADPLLPYPHGEALAAAIPGAELLPLAGVGHQHPPPSTWDTVVPALLRVSSGGWQLTADRLAARAVAAGEPTAWFDRLYSAADAGEVPMPWDRDQANPLLVDWATPGTGSAAVVGAGLGEDAEHLAALGWRTTAFDVSPTAVDLARRRHPGSTVDYRVADLLDLPADLLGAYDLVVDAYTVQALPRDIRPQVATALASLLAPGGTLLLIQVQHAGDDSGPPWLLTRTDLDLFPTAGLTEINVEVVHHTGRTLRRAEYRRPNGSAVPEDDL